MDSSRPWADVEAPKAHHSRPLAAVAVPEMMPRFCDRGSDHGPENARHQRLGWDDLHTSPPRGLDCAVRSDDSPNETMSVKSVTTDHCRAGLLTLVETDSGHSDLAGAEDVGD